MFPNPHLRFAFTFDLTKLVIILLIIHIKRVGITNSMKKNINFISELLLPMFAKVSRARRQRVLVGIGLLATIGALIFNIASNYLPEFPDRTRDLILKWRLSSPPPSDRIIILDIDERSLALLASEHGRWPWSRAVLAQGLQSLAEKEARAVLFNVLISDPDTRNEEGDLELALTSQLLANVAYPLVRLAPENDDESELQVAAIPGSVTTDDTNRTIAAILPMFEGMALSAGVTNQQPDRDGVIRTHRRIWEEEGFKLPSIVERTLVAGGFDTAAVPEDYALNWRNKKGRYERISFADFFQAPDDPSFAEKLRGAWVVINVSAPGLGQTKPTAVAPVEDDGEILATAIDDAINGTYLREVPEEVLLVLNIAVVWILITLAIRNRAGEAVDRMFFISQGSLAGIMYLSASYSNFYVDLGDNISFAIGVFGAIKIVQSLDDKWVRAAKGYRKSQFQSATGRLVLLGYPIGRAVDGGSDLRVIERSAERIVGLDSVLRIDDLFGGQSLIRQLCEPVVVLACWAEEHEVAALEQLVEQNMHLKHKWLAVTSAWNVSAPGFLQELAPEVLRFSAELVAEP